MSKEQENRLTKIEMDLIKTQRKRGICEEKQKSTNRRNFKNAEKSHKGTEGSEKRDFLL